MRVLAVFALCASAAMAQTTDVDATNAAQYRATLIKEVYGSCGCVPTGATTANGSGTFSGYTYQTLIGGGAKFFDTDSDRLMIYHAGHSQDALSTASALIQYALNADWDVLLVNMPPEPHNAFAGQAQPLINFLNPVTLALNYVLKGREYESITMAGLSGGGWTTVLYAAIDERITRSIPVAGSWPEYLREASSNPADKGDFEQELPGVSLSYMDLYALATTSGREQLQIFNSQDPCCFAGSAPLGYEAEVQASATSLGGAFDIIIVDNNQHTVHASVFDDIAGEGSPPPEPPPYISARWELDDTTGTVVSGMYPGTYFNGPTKGVTGLVAPGTAVAFDGVNDYATVPDQAALRPGLSQYSIEMWAKFDSTNYGMAFGKFDFNFPYAGTIVFFNHANNTVGSTPGKVSMRDKSDINFYVNSTAGGLNDNVVRHYVFQRRETSPGVWKLEIYINGVLDAEKTLPSVENLVTTNGIYLFSRADASQTIRGTFDHVTYLVGTALTPAEVLAHYNSP